MQDRAVERVGKPRANRLVTVLHDQHDVDRRDPVESVSGTGAPQRWRLHRAGIINVYQYENETIDFAGGRLLLRGVNGSGKTTAMNMLLPFLLTASQQRIDASGEQSGILKSWMLSGRDDAQPAGYIWLELERPVDHDLEVDADGHAAVDVDDEEGAVFDRPTRMHLSIGCGIKANRSSDSVTTWWFVTDRRPGIDLALVEHGVAVSPDALRGEIGSDHVYTHDRRRDYRSEVARRLYGGVEPDRFIDLLNTVRNPRIGDRIDVDLPRHLSEALPQLSDQSLADAARPLDDLDEHRRNVENLRVTTDALRAIGDVHHDYLVGDLAAHADAARATLEESRRAESDARRSVSASADAADVELRANERVDALKAETQRLRIEIETLQHRPEFIAGQDLDDRRTRVRELERDLEGATQRVRSLAERAIRVTDEIRRAASTVRSDVGELGEVLTGIAGGAGDVHLAQRPPSSPVVSSRPLDMGGAALVLTRHGVGGQGPTPEIPADLADPVETASTRTQLTAVAGAAERRRADVDDVRAALDRVDRADRTLELVRRERERADDAVGVAETTFESARNHLADVSLAWDTAVDAWVAEAGALRDRHRTDESGSDVDAPDRLDRDARRENLAAVFGVFVRALQERTAAANARLEAAERDVGDAQALVDELAARTEPEPPVAPWQSRTAPCFADLVDFADHVPPDQRGAIEGALDASGLLAAEVVAGDLRLADGRLVATPAAATSTASTGSTLADLLVAIVPDDAAIDRSHVDRLLATISTDPTMLDLRDDDQVAGSPVITIDGRFRIGPLAGQHRKAVAEYVGAGARRDRLERQRADAAAELERRRTERDRAADELEADRDADDAASGHLEALPTLTEVDRADGRAADAERQLDDSRIALDEAVATHGEAERAHAAAADEAARTARTHQLPASRAELDDVIVTLTDVAVQCRAAGSQIGTVDRSGAAWTSAVERWRGVADDLVAADRERGDRNSAHRDAETSLATLEDSIGLSYREVLGALEQSRGDLTVVADQLPGAESVRDEAIREHQRALDRADEDERRRVGADAACRSRVDRLRTALGVAGVVATVMTAATGPSPEVGADGDGLADLVGWLDTTIAANELWTGASPSADGVRNSVRQRRDSLGGGWDAEARQPDPLLPLSVSVTGPLGTDMALPDAIAAVTDQLAQNEALLTQKQDAALRTLLHGVVATEVAEKLFAAGQLIDAMNDRLAPVTTVHGIGVRLRWRRHTELDPNTSRVADLLAKVPDLRTTDEDDELRDALAARLEDARRIDPDVAYRELIADVLDYRQWYDLAVMVRRAGDTERRLTKRTPLSEGEKKLVTYQPLFAAVAAACDQLAATSPTAPRFVLLDDAFAKVSEDNHAKLFGLLVDLDLDFIATSERLWGTHATVPELAITEVVRDADAGVILLEHARWNGRELVSGTDRVPVS